MYFLRMYFLEDVLFKDVLADGFSNTFLRAMLTALLWGLENLSKTLLKMFLLLLALPVHSQVTDELAEAKLNLDLNVLETFPNPQIVHG